MFRIVVLTALFIFLSFVSNGQQSYAKTILNEQYNGYSQSGSLTTCQDTSLAVFSFIPVKASGFYSNELIALKHDSLGLLFSKQFLRFPEQFQLYSSHWYHNKIFVVLSLFPQGGTGDPRRRLAFLRFSNNLILEKSVVFFTSGLETNNPSVLNEAPDSTLIFSASSNNSSGGLGDQILAQLDFDLNVVQSVELPQQFRYTLPAFHNGTFQWYTYEGRYVLDNNFNTISTDSLINSDNTLPSVIAFQNDTAGIKLKIRDNASADNSTRIVRFDNNRFQQNLLLTAGYGLYNVNGGNQNLEYYQPYLNANDSIRVDIFTIVEDSGYTLKQTLSLNDTNYINVKPHRQSFGHFLVEHIDPRDTSINFLKGVDSIPAASCLSISFPPDTIVDTNNLVYSFVPHTSTPPPLTKNINFLTQPYVIQTIDSLNASGDTTLPALEFKCINKSCGVFTPPNGGLQCNRDQVLLQIQRENPFGLDTNQFITRIVWNDTFEQDTYLVRGPNAQTVKVFGENYFCEQTAYLSFDFDSVRATSSHRGDICLDFPSTATIQVDGLFESITWQDPTFDNSTFQTVYLPGSYPFSVRSLKGCQLNLNAVVPEVCAPKIYIPNAFTPNGDGTNDSFVGYADFTDEFIFRIYDRWGQVIFTTNTSPIVWDGTYKGELVQIGVYNWRLVYNSIYLGDLYVKDLFGHITVVR